MYLYEHLIPMQAVFTSLFKHREALPKAHSLQKRAIEIALWLSLDLWGRGEGVNTGVENGVTTVCWDHEWILQGAFSFGALVGFERSTVLQHPKYVYEKLQVCQSLQILRLYRNIHLLQIVLSSLLLELTSVFHQNNVSRLAGEHLGWLEQQLHCGEDLEYAICWARLQGCMIVPSTFLGRAIII